jgi:hypothetical protein
VRLKLIGCHLLARELCDAVVRSPHLVDVELLAAGLHNDGARAMRTRIQRAIDATEAGRYDAVVLGYALCGGGLAGIVARDARLVLPRAHDCITLLLGGRGRYNDCFARNSGVYYRSTGWVERADEMAEQYLGMANESDLDTLIDRYGEDNGRYLYQQLTAYRRSYSELAFISTGLEPDDRFLASARREAGEKGWTFARINGDLALFRRLLSGAWDDDFLIVPPSYRITATYDEAIVAAQPALSVP